MTGFVILVWSKFQGDAAESLDPIARIRIQGEVPTVGPLVRAARGAPALVRCAVPEQGTALDAMTPVVLLCCDSHVRKSLLWCCPLVKVLRGRRSRPPSTASGSAGRRPSGTGSPAIDVNFSRDRFVTLRVIAISCQASAVSRQPSAVSRQPSSNMSPPKSCCSCPGTMSRDRSPADRGP